MSCDPIKEPAVNLSISSDVLLLDQLAAADSIAGRGCMAAEHSLQCHQPEHADQLNIIMKSIDLRRHLA